MSPRQPESADTPNDTVEIPDLDGIDVAAGLKRVAGNRKLYRNLLRQFAEGQSGVAEAIETALAAGDRAVATRLAHTVKGVSGNIGASDLHQRATMLEASLRGDEAAGAVNVQDFAAELDRVLRSLAALSTAVTTNQDASPRPAVDRATLQPLLSQLNAYLADFDGEAADYFEEIHDQMAAAICKSDLSRLESQIRAFEFDEALVSLDRVASTLDVAL